MAPGLGLGIWQGVTTSPTVKCRPLIGFALAVRLRFPGHWALAEQWGDAEI